MKFREGLREVIKERLRLIKFGESIEVVPLFLRLFGRLDQQISAIPDIGRVEIIGLILLRLSRLSGADENSYRQG